ncbi:MAG: hypothetical protein KJ697_04680 [Nanoarchaeota archaeon]|nr:hypothetical protein [Nanoarchaeota archaeon]MBU4124371.1 hypothetical protein [Nanoarchaeota archaeon]
MIYIKKINVNAITKIELDWLIGLFYADGSKYIDKRTYRTVFYLNPKKDMEVIDKVKNILTKMNVRFHTRISKGAMEIKATCKNFFLLMPMKQIKYFPSNADAFIAGFLDGDGYVSGNTIGFSQTIVKWIGPYIFKYLKQKGIKPWRNAIYRNCYYYRTSFKKVKEKTNIVKSMSVTTTSTNHACG